MSSTVGYEVRRVQDAAEYKAALNLRFEVFCREQGVPESEERDGRDHESLHLIAIADGQIVGTCRILMIGDTSQFSRLAVDGRVRRRGIATALLRAADEETLAAGGKRLVLHAQTYARSLYEQAGYRARGREFTEAGIEHVAMEKKL